jgi:predicted TIM-barrel fold metal-dependent hydrolase
MHYSTISNLLREDQINRSKTPFALFTYEIFGASQIVFAADFPHGPGKSEKRLATYPDVIRSLGFPPNDIEKIFSGNACQYLKL